MDFQKITETATLLAEEIDADILLYNSSINRDRPYDAKVIDACRKAKRRKTLF